MRSWVLGAAVALALVATGCIAPSEGGTKGTTPSPPPGCEPTAAGSPTTIGGPQQGAVSNNPRAFSYSGQVAAKSGKEEFAWQNPSSTAHVAWGGQASTGSVKVTILDACSKSLLTESYGAGQQGTYKDVGPAQPGQWLIRLEFAAFTGQMGFSVTS